MKTGSGLAKGDLRKNKKGAVVSLRGRRAIMHHDHAGPLAHSVRRNYICRPIWSPNSTNFEDVQNLDIFKVGGIAGVLFDIESAW